MRLNPSWLDITVSAIGGGALGAIVMHFVGAREYNRLLKQLEEQESPVVFCRCPLVDKRFDSKDLDDCA
jgi:hypothetical protein